MTAENEPQEKGQEDPGSEDPRAEDPGAEDPGAEDPGAEDPGAEHPSSRAQPASPPSLAKRLEEEQRVESRARWTVGGARRACAACGAEISPRSTFYSTLIAAPIPTDDARMVNVSELFERKDHCEDCFEDSLAESSFAHWKSVMDPPLRAPRKSINLAALLAYFNHLGGAEHGDELDPGSPPGFPPTLPETDHHQLRFLLALFLIRKRVLRWRKLTGEILTVDEVRSDRTHDIRVPEGDRADRELALQAFEELFA